VQATTVVELVSIATTQGDVVTSKLIPRESLASYGHTSL
jgi:hypothetical protein